MKHRWYLLSSALIVLSLVLAACGSPSAGNTPVPGTSGTSAAPGAETSAAPTSAPVMNTEAPTEAATTAPAGGATEMATTAATTAATSGAPAASGGCPLQVEQGATITFSGWGDTTEQKVYRDSIDRFKAVCPGVTVNYTPIPDKFQDKMKAQMAGGTAPDVMYVDDQLMTAFAPSGQLLALDDYMQQAGVSANDFIPALMKEFTLDGKTYGLPKDWGTLGLIYLPEAFTDAGIAEPTENWTWDDMRTAAKAIAAKGKFGGFCMAADWARFAPFVLSGGGDFASQDNKTATLDQAPVTDAATLVGDMFKEKSLVQPSDVGASWCGEAIGKKLVAMTTEGGWMVNFMKQTYPDVQYKAMLIPQGAKNRADIIFTNALGVNAATKYPKASAALAMYITGKDNQAEIVKTGFAYSTHPDQANLITNPIDQAISKGGLLPDSRVAYWGPYTGKLEDSVSKAIERVFKNQQSVADSFAQAQQEAQSALNGQ